MSLSSALTNAASGLGASARLAETVSNNVSNALTPGYGRRSAELSSLALGGYGSGVRVAGSIRAENVQLTAERRGMDAALGASSALTSGYERVTAALGEPGRDTALAARAVALETALLSSVSSPQSTTRLTEAVAAAKALAGAINTVAKSNAEMRTEADAEIGRQVAQVNTALDAIAEINRKIGAMSHQGQDTGGLQDERARLIDGISGIVPLRTVKRENDQIALYTQNGGALLDGKPFKLVFDPAPATVTPEMVLGAPLSGLGQDRGNPAGPSAVGTGEGELMAGGSLGALFELRDRIVPGVDAELDRYAEDLIGRMRDLMPAEALDAGGEGLFVDPAQGGTPGLAGRIAVNAAADPAQGGAVWRLRDGLGAAAPGPAGFGTVLSALSDAMTTARAPVGFTSQAASNSSAGFAAEITAFFAGHAARADDQRAYATGQQALMAEREVGATGVDTDSELQSLMLVEQAYAANARVLSVVDSLLKQLLEI